MDTYFDAFLKKLEENGSILSIQELKEMREKIKYYEHSNYKNILFSILEDLKNVTFLDKVTYGFLTSIDLGNDLLKVIGGTTCHGEEITENTMFDVASITKLFTLLLILRLKEQNILDLNEPILDDFPKIKDVTILDLISMKGEFRTKQRLEILNKEKAKEVLKQTYLYQSKRYLYSDIPMIILSDMIKAKVNQKFKINLTYDEIMNMFLLNPFKIEACFNAKNHRAGTGKNPICFDPKAQVLGSIGSAGLFVSSKGFDMLSKNITKIVSKEDLFYLYSKIYEDVSKGYAGLYQKYPDFSKTYVPLEYSNKCFASEGSTGSVFISDLSYQIHNHILVDAINETNQKDENFQSNFNLYQKCLTTDTILLYFFKEYFEKYKSKDNIKIIVKK